MRILITNVYSSQNKGDAAIVTGMLKDLGSQKLFTDADIRISSANYPNDKGKYACPVVASFHSVKNAFCENPYLRCLSFLLIILPISFLWAVWWRLTGRSLVAPKDFLGLFIQYAQADIIIAVGGGYLYTRSPVFGNIVLLITIWCFFYGILLGKPVYLYSQSIGPFSHRCQAWLVKLALRKVRLVEVREKTSLTLLRTWHIKTPVHETVDSAFLVEESPRVFSVLAGKANFRVGLTVRKWFRDTNLQKTYEHILAEFVDWLITEVNASVIFVPQVTFAKGDDDDRLVARKLCQILKSERRFQLIEEELSPEEIVGLCGNMEFFVGTRMHSNIFALSMNVPTLAIEYQPKTRGIMKQLGMDDFVLSINNLSINELKAKFIHLFRNSDSIRKSLKQRIPELRDEVRHNGQLIADDYKLLLETRITKS